MENLSLELSKRLHELGVKVESEYIYDRYNKNAYPLRVKDLSYEPDMDFYIPAPTFEELWAVMPRHIETQNRVWWLHLSKASNEISQAEYLDFKQTIKGTQFAESPTEALGQLLIWLEATNATR